MALTLAQAAKLSNDLVLQGIYETILNDDPLADMIQFMGIKGNALTYNQELAAAAVTWYETGDTWTESVATYTQKSATLRIVGGDADVDQYMATTRDNINDLEATVIESKAKAVWEEVRKKMIVGENKDDVHEPDGLKKLIPAGQTTALGTNGGELNLGWMDALTDLIRGGGPDFYLMSRRSRRKLTALMRAAGGGVLPTVLSAFGKMVPTWNERPIYISDYITDDETQGNKADCSTVYAVTVGEDAFVGLNGGGSILQVENVGALETKDAHRTRVKGYLAFALFSEKTCAQLIGVRVA